LKRRLILPTALTAALFLTMVAALCFAAYAMGNRSQDQNEFAKFDYECCTKEKAIVAESLAPDERANLTIGIIKADLNDDGLEDLLSQIQSSIHCGTAGCLFRILIQKSDGTYVEVKGPSNTYWEVKIANDVTNGMHDLFFHVNQTDLPCLWKWNGKEYEFNSCRKGS
jgi:hypothetical protein